MFFVYFCLYKQRINEKSVYESYTACVHYQFICIVMHNV